MTQLLILLWSGVVLAEFHAEVLGRDTLIGCFIRGIEDVQDGRCSE